MYIQMHSHALSNIGASRNFDSQQASGKKLPQPEANVALIWTMS